MTGGLEVGLESWWGKRKGRRRREPRCGEKDERERGGQEGGRVGGDKGSVRGMKLRILRRAVKGECVPNTAVLVPQGTQTLP